MSVKTTETYHFNLIDKTDTFSPDPLNENMEKVEETFLRQSFAKLGSVEVPANGTASMPVSGIDDYAFLMLDVRFKGGGNSAFPIKAGGIEVLVIATGSNIDGAHALVFLMPLGTITGAVRLAASPNNTVNAAAMFARGPAWSTIKSLEFGTFESDVSVILYGVRA